MSDGIVRCEVCDTTLEMNVKDGYRVVFKNHTPEFCVQAARLKIRTLVTALQRLELDFRFVEEGRIEALRLIDWLDHPGRLEDVLGRMVNENVSLRAAAWWLRHGDKTPEQVHQEEAERVERSRLEALRLLPELGAGLVKS